MVDSNALALGRTRESRGKMAAQDKTTKMKDTPSTEKNKTRIRCTCYLSGEYKYRLTSMKFCEIHGVHLK